MILKVQIDDQLLELNVPEAVVEQAEDFFSRMDADMDQGWQVDREWVEQPDQMLRGQIAANKLLTALENEDHKLGRLMAGYIVSRIPDIETIELNPAGETRDHRIKISDATGQAPSQDITASMAHPGIPTGLNKMEAMAQAAGILAFKTDNIVPGEDSTYYLAGIDKTRFKRPVVPGDQLRMEIRLLKSKRGIWVFEGKAYVDDDLAVATELMCTVKS